MRQTSLFRDVLLLAVAGTLGWWAHSTAPVHAAAPTSLPLAFQLFGTGSESTLNVYDPESHYLFVYPMRGGNDNVGCIYSYYIKAPGAAIERGNCKPAPVTSH